ncbi:MAG: CPXCG motif-containing cysteine-rich protein [Flavobacteriaceae bacterium]|nr:CPXCG motif-containing cysteine-rich protein [Flavobacteriaceae bacterium]
MIEYFFTCPSCWQQVSLLVDISIKEQNFIEDCEVCCRPLDFLISIENEEIVSFDVQLTQ